MKIAVYLLLAGSGMLLVWGANSHGQAPEAQEPPVVVRDLPLAVGHGYGFPVGARDQRDIEADQQVAALLKKLHDAKDDTAKTELQKKLTDTLAKQFDVRQGVRERELKELEDRVKRLRRDAEGLGWGEATHEVQGYAVPRFSPASAAPAR